MANYRTKPGEGLAGLFRQAASQAKQPTDDNVDDMLSKMGAKPLGSDGRSRPHTPRIFSIIDYIEQPWGLKMHLFPVQKFIVKLFYHIELDDKNKTIDLRDMFNTRTVGLFTEKEYLQYLHKEGRCNIGEQDHERRELVLSIGRRGGKTTLSSLFASYEVYRLLNLSNPQAYYGLPNGNTIQIISVATDKDQAGILFREVSGHLSRCEYFSPYILSNTKSWVDFQTPFDIERFGPITRHQDGKFVSFNGKSSIRVTFRSSIAKGLRGMGNIIVILDEMAHFIDEGGSSAKEIYDAVTPSTAAFSPKSPDDGMPVDGTDTKTESRIICISSPLNKQGKFFDLFQQAMAGGPAAENKIAIQAPTWEINPTVPSSYYKQKYHEDPNVFATEHGAEFSDRVRGWIERRAYLEACIDPEMRPCEGGTPRAPHQMGVDVAVVGDGTAISITHVEEDCIVLDYHEVWYAGVDWRESNPHLQEPPTPYAKSLTSVERLDFEEIAKWISVICRRFYITEGIFDRWEGLSLEQSLHKIGLTQFTSEFFTKDLSSKMYQAMKLLMFDKKLRLYDYPTPPFSADPEAIEHSPFIAELLSLQATQVSKNVVVVEAPQTKGCHDDMSDAFARSVWLSMKHVGAGKMIAGVHSPVKPYAAGGNSIATYQRTRARNHAGFTERTVPRNVGMRFRPR